MNEYSIVSAIIKKGHKYLIGKRALTKKFAPGKWEFISGFIEEGEDPADTIVRELKEELDADVKTLKKSETYRIKDDEGIWTITNFKVKLHSLDNLKPKEEEHSEIRWASAEQIRKIDEMRFLRF